MGFMHPAKRTVSHGDDYTQKEEKEEKQESKEGGRKKIYEQTTQANVPKQFVEIMNMILRFIFSSM